MQREHGRAGRLPYTGDAARVPHAAVRARVFLRLRLREAVADLLARRDIGRDVTSRRFFIMVRCSRTLVRSRRHWGRGKAGKVRVWVQEPVRRHVFFAVDEQPHLITL